jgi:hypothetical protein
MRFSFAAQLGEHIEHFAFEGMVRAYNTNLAGEVLGVGSVS